MKKLIVKSIRPASAAMLSASLVGVASLGALLSTVVKAIGGEATAAMVGFQVLFVLLYTLWGVATGYLFGYTYNALARRFGGLEIEVDTRE